MRNIGTLYVDGNSLFHKLDGTIKLALFLAWTVTAIVFLDIRVFVVLSIVGILLLALAQVPFKTIKPLLIVMLVFNVINSLFILVITPQYGSELAGTYTPLINMGYSVLTTETLFYVLTLSLKYATLLPITIIFVFTTHPSEFACSLGKIGVSYKIGYAISIAFRYIPDVQEEFQNISHSLEARGISYKKGSGTLSQRLKSFTMIFSPLISSALERIDTVTNAMSLRGFGKDKTRTWYVYKKCTKMDYLVLGASLVVMLGAIILSKTVFGGFYYPFG